MHQYLQDTKYAALNLFQLATKEDTELGILSDKLAGSEQKLKAHQWDFRTSDLNDDFPEAYVMGAFVRAGNAGLEVQQLRTEVAKLQSSLGTHQHSVQAIAGAILQIAKQGISLVHGGLSSAPAGRLLGSLAVRDIVWQARNQSMHYEEGNFKKPLVTLFSALEREQGPQFSLTKSANQNRAKQILDTLGWISYDAYAKDMKVLLP